MKALVLGGRLTSRRPPINPPRIPRAAPGIRELCEPERTSPVPSFGGPGARGRCERNCRRSNSCESSKCGRSPGFAGSGSVVKYGCLRASMALIRRRQSSFRSSLSKEIASGPWLFFFGEADRSAGGYELRAPTGGTNSLKTWLRLPDLFPKFLTPSHPGNALHPGIFSSVGVPTRLKISCAWFKSLFPVRIGFPLNISPNTQLIGVS